MKTAGPMRGTSVYKRFVNPLPLVVLWLLASSGCGVLREHSEHSVFSSARSVLGQIATKAIKESIRWRAIAKELEPGFNFRRSPEQEAIAFLKYSASDRKYSLATLELSTKKLKVISRGVTSFERGAGRIWSPDGRMLAICRGEWKGDQEELWQVMIYDSRSGEGHPLLERSGAISLSAPAWHPDSTHLAVIVTTTNEIGRTDAELQIIGMSGGCASFPVMHDVVLQHGVSWSPDGRWIALSVERWSGEGNVLALFDCRTHEITEAGEIGEPLSSDPLWIGDKYLCVAAGDMYVLNLSTMRMECIPRGGLVIGLARCPKTDVVLFCESSRRFTVCSLVDEFLTLGHARNRSYTYVPVLLDVGTGAMRSIDELVWVDARPDRRPDSIPQLAPLFW